MATIVVGNGVGYFAGDGGMATNAGLYGPYAVSVDSLGRMFIADSYNSRIRKVDTNGVVSTVAGTGVASYSGDGGAATNAALNYPQGICVNTIGNLLIADTANGKARLVKTNGIISLVYSQSQNTLSMAGVAMYSSNILFVADNYSHQVFKLTPIGGTSSYTTTPIAGKNLVSGYSGNGGFATNAYLNYPMGITLDSAQNER
jgi:hypothetical protein